jgi:hypothetical protein
MWIMHGFITFLLICGQSFEERSLRASTLLIGSLSPVGTRDGGDRGAVEGDHAASEFLRENICGPCNGPISARRRGSRSGLESLVSTVRPPEVAFPARGRVMAEIPREGGPRRASVKDVMRGLGPKSSFQQSTMVATAPWHIAGPRMSAAIRQLDDHLGRGMPGGQSSEDIWGRMNVTLSLAIPSPAIRLPKMYLQTAHFLSRLLGIPSAVCDPVRLPKLPAGGGRAGAPPTGKAPWGTSNSSRSG